MKAFLLLSACLLAPAADLETTALAHAERARQLTLAAKDTEAVEEWKAALRLTPRNPVFHNLYGLTLQQAGRPTAAQAEFRQALRLQPNFTDARSNLVYSLWQSRDYPQAALELDPLLRLSPFDSSLHLLRGQIFTRSADSASACREFGLAMPWPKEPAVLGEIFESCLLAGNRQLFLQAAHSFPPDPQTALTIGSWLLANGRPAESISFLNTAASSEALHDEAGLLLSEGFLASCEPGKALDVLSHVERKSPAAVYQFRDLRGSALLALDRVREAEADFGSLIQDFPNLPDAYIAATQIPLQQKRWDDALALLNDGLQRLPGNWLLLFRRGMVFKLSGHLDEAKVDFVGAIRADGDVALVTAALGDLEAQTGNLSQAADLFEQTWQQTKLPQFLLAHALVMDRLGNSAQALEELRKLTRDWPSNQQAHYSLGKILQRQGSLEEARVELEAVRTLDDGFAANLYALGRLYLTLGEREKARSILAEFEKAKQHADAGICAASKPQLSAADAQRP